MKKKEKYHHGGLKSKLIEDVLLAIKNNTLEKYSIRESARLMGVSAAAPYNHYKDKKELVDSALLFSRKNFLKFLSDKLNDKDLHTQKLISLGKNYLSFADKNPKLFIFMFTFTNEDNVSDNYYIDIYNLFYEVISTSFDTDNFRSRISLNTAVYAAWSMVHGIASLIANRSINKREIKGYIEGKLFDELSAIWAVGVSKPPKYRL